LQQKIKKMKVISKLFAIIFVILCLVSAYLQLNDPDPLLWICLYLAAAVIAILFVLKKLPKLAYFLFFLGYLIGAYLFWPVTFEGVSIGGGDIINIEHARESLGLFILSAVMFIFWVKSKKDDKQF